MLILTVVEADMCRGDSHLSTVTGLPTSTGSGLVAQGGAGKALRGRPYMHRLSPLVGPCLALPGLRGV